MSSPSKHKEAGKGKNATTCNFGSNSNGCAKEASTSKEGNTMKTTNSFDVLNSLEGDLTAHDEPSFLKDSTQRAGHCTATTKLIMDLSKLHDSINIEVVYVSNIKGVPSLVATTLNPSSVNVVIVISWILTQIGTLFKSSLETLAIGDHLRKINGTLRINHDSLSSIAYKPMFELNLKKIFLSNSS
nr:hypothetical protein [Tanacetum cinerariifolium]